MKIKKQLVHREIAGEHVLIPLGELAQTHPGLFAVNEQAAFLWEQLPHAENEHQLLVRLLETYDVDEDTAEEDLREFLDALKQLDIL